MNHPVRRSSFTAQPVTYAAVGATLAADLAVHPPKGFKSFEHSVRLGSGRDRFLTASRALMTWGVQRGAGVTVTDVQPGTGEEYAGIRYAADGTPEKLIPHRGTEAVFDEDGNPYISNGMSAVLILPVGRATVHAPVRIVYVIEEERRAGFGCGSLEGHPLCGEESFILEHRDDDSVWLVIRSFSKPSGGKSTFVAPFVRGGQSSLVKRYLRALHPTAGNPGVPVTSEDTGIRSDEPTSVVEITDAVAHDAASPSDTDAATDTAAVPAPHAERPSDR
jgi:uncharacterized protein (UPF0548 family)